MPRRVFAKPPLERKPFCLDLDSPVLRRIALRHIRAAAANAPIRFSEMLPDSDHCWLGDADALALHERAAAAMRRLSGRVILRTRAGDSRGPANREGGTMPLYLTRFSYTPETWARLIGNPEDRRKAAQAYIESVGGKLHGFWYAFGEHDAYTLYEAPDNVSMAAVALAITAGGALSSLETTALLTVDETMEALRKAQQVGYRAPGA